MYHYMISYIYFIMIIVDSCMIWFHFDCIMQLKISYHIATNVCSRKSATTFGNLPDCSIVYAHDFVVFCSVVILFLIPNNLLYVTCLLLILKLLWLLYWNWLDCLSASEGILQSQTVPKHSKAWQSATTSLCVFFMISHTPMCISMISGVCVQGKWNAQVKDQVTETHRLKANSHCDTALFISMNDITMVQP